MKKSWILCDKGKVGTLKQCQGLAQALGLTPCIKPIDLRFPWRVLSPFLQAGVLYGQRKETSALTPPWPEIIIAAGRASAAPCLALRQKLRHQGRLCTNIFLQSPHCSALAFDLVIAPQHDQLSGKNVIQTLGALNDLTESTLSKAARLWNQTMHLPAPYISVLIGGDSKHYTYKSEDIKKFAEELRQVSHKMKSSLLITPSRRTPRWVLDLLEATLSIDTYVIWKGQLPNPYLAYLKAADILIVTSDSVSMASEACFTGKPTYVYSLPVRSSKIDQFHQDLYNCDHARPFQLDIIGEGVFKPLQEAQRIAPLVKEFLRHRND